jgi:hypothetical protein
MKPSSLFLMALVVLVALVLISCGGTAPASQVRGAGQIKGEISYDSCTVRLVSGDHGRILVDCSSPNQGGVIPIWVDNQFADVRLGSIVNISLSESGRYFIVSYQN